MTLYTQIVWFFILPIPIACLAWTVTHEEIFAELRNYCQKQSINGRSILRRKFFYLFTCEYCFSFYVTAIFLFLTRYHLLMAGWIGYLISELSLVWMANMYMSLFLFIRTDINKERIVTKVKEEGSKE